MSAPRPITLQPCEARVVQRLVAGEKPEVIANAEGITVATVHTYTKRAAARIPGPERGIVRLTLWVYGLRTHTPAPMHRTS